MDEWAGGWDIEYLDGDIHRGANFVDHRNPEAGDHNDTENADPPNHHQMWLPIRCPHALRECNKEALQKNSDEKSRDTPVMHWARA